MVIENSYWLDVVKNSDIGQVYAEHYKYLSIKPLQKFFDSHGFDLFKVTFNQVQCGSFRAYIKWKANNNFNIDESVGAAIKTEEEFGLYNIDVYDGLRQDLAILEVKLCMLLKQLKKEGKTIGIFSVPAKIVLLLQYMGIKEFFDLATDDSFSKWQKFIPGTLIKIVPPEEFWQNKFDYVLIGAYNFFRDIKQNNCNKKTKWIRILPFFEISD